MEENLQELWNSMEWTNIWITEAAEETEEGISL